MAATKKAPGPSALGLRLVEEVAQRATAGNAQEGCHNVKRRRVGGSHHQDNADDHGWSHDDLRSGRPVPDTRRGCRRVGASRADSMEAGGGDKHGAKGGPRMAAEVTEVGGGRRQMGLMKKMIHSFTM
jgi:hypothetical protein